MAIDIEQERDGRVCRYWHIDAITWRKDQGLRLDLAGYADAADRQGAWPVAMARDSLLLPCAPPTDLPQAYALLLAADGWDGAVSC